MQLKEKCLTNILRPNLTSLYNPELSYKHFNENNSYRFSRNVSYHGTELSQGFGRGTHPRSFYIVSPPDINSTIKSLSPKSGHGCLMILHKYGYVPGLFQNIPETSQ